MSNPSGFSVSGHGDMSLVLDDEVSKDLMAKLESHKWWLIVAHDTHLCQRVEERYYMGENSPDFEVLLSSTGVVVASAKKSRMTPEQFVDCVAEMSFEGGEAMTADERITLIRELTKRDVFFVVKDGDSADASANYLMGAFAYIANPTKK